MCEFVVKQLWNKGENVDVVFLYTPWGSNI